MFYSLQHNCLFSLPGVSLFTFLVCVSINLQFVEFIILDTCTDIHVHTRSPQRSTLNFNNFKVGFFPSLCKPDPKYERAGKFLLMIYGCENDLSVDHLWQKPNVSVPNLLISKLL